jgi:hypothetical protein
MRIISEFKDYYDVVQSTGQDQGLIYLRKPDKYPKKESEPYRWPFPALCEANRNLNYGLYIIEFIVGFCGKIYPALKFCRSTDRGSVEACCHNINDVYDFMNNNFRKKELINIWDGNYYKFYSTGKKSCEKFFEECEKKQNSYKELFMEHHCPIFVAKYHGRYGNKSITYNGSLRETEFFKVFDPYTAFQEISMYVSNMAVPLKEIPKIPDKTLAEAKGFDKYSFRKEKST